MGKAPHSGFDHVTIAVEDLDGAVAFFGLLGFERTHAVVVSGEEMSRYMGIPDWEADHVTLELRGGVTHQEVQLLRFSTSALPSRTWTPPWPGSSTPDCTSATTSSSSTTGAWCSCPGRVG
jgi:catechol 2,3-dioxygenase-like lactoylglutathione lyase family enzyme